MKTIREFEDVLESKGASQYDYRNNVIFQAYLCSRIFDDELLNFHLDVKPSEVQSIVEFCHFYGIDRITITGQLSFAQDVLWEFQQHGCTIKGIVQLTDRKAHAASKSAFLIAISDAKLDTNTERRNIT